MLIMTNARLNNCLTLLAHAAALLALCLSVEAKPASPADLKAVNACLASADKAGEFGAACIGTIADPCLQAAGGETTRAKACAERELAVWDAVAEAATRRIRAGGFKEISKAVADAQKIWAQQRDALCPVFDKVDPGALPGDGAYCRMQVTAQRALLLRRLGAAVSKR